MEDYLIAQGIASYRIIKEEASTTTQENLKFSKRYMNCGEADVGIVSNNFHLYRACAYARRLGYGHPYPLASGAACKLHGQRMLCRVEDVAVFLILRKQCVIVSI